jgi:hypothetical protein
MKQAFALTVVLIGVIAAIVYLKRKAEDAPRAPAPPPASAAPGDGGAEAAPGMRTITLTRLVPSYTLRVKGAGDAGARRTAVLDRVASRGGKVAGALPEDPRSGFRVELPEGGFKPLLRDLGSAKLEVRIQNRPPKPVTTGPAPMELEIVIEP